MTTYARFTLTYAAAFAVFGMAAGQRRAVAYLAVLGVTAALAYAAHRVARFTPAVCWALSLAGLLHLIGGLLPSPQAGAPVFYETWLLPGALKYDQAVHAIVSAVLTFAAWQLVGRRRGLAATAVVAFALGGLNEAVEFASALRFHDAYVGGFENTYWDIVFNSVGIAGASLWLGLPHAPPRQRDDSAPRKARSSPSRRSPPTPTAASRRASTASPGRPRRATNGAGSHTP